MRIMVKKSLRSVCAETVRNEDRDRFLSAMFAPAKHREALFALYAFNLEIARIRETVSEPLIGQMRLQWWRDVIVSIKEGKPPHHPVAEALAETFKAYELTQSHFERLIDAREADMTDELPENIAALIDYAKSTSVPLIQLSLDILGVKNEAAHRVAEDIGLAWSLTGLLRALPAYAVANRYFIPKDVCLRYDQDVYAFVSSPASEQFKAFVAEMTEIAKMRISSARSLQAEIPKQACAALLPATIAESYLSILSRAGFDPYKARVERLSPWGMTRMMLKGFRGSY